MSISEGASILRRGLNDCAYEFGSSSYQDRCEGISVDYSGSTIYVVIVMHVPDPSNEDEVYDNITSIIDSLRHQYDIPYRIEYEVRCR